jgi:leader peptidase (prepilin peptidase)/N-methyltransferase
VIAPTIAFGLVLAAILVALARIDLARMILPDWLNALLGAIGLVQALWLDEPTLIDALLGGLFAGALMWAVALAYRRWRGVDGLGFGDVKLGAAGALWSGVAGVGPMLLAATASCAAVLLLRAARGEAIDAGARFPFGPFLAFGVFAAWMITHLA